MVRALPVRADDVRPPALLLTVVLVTTAVVGNRVLWKSLDGVEGGMGAEFPFWLPQVGPYRPNSRVLCDGLRLTHLRRDPGYAPLAGVRARTTPLPEVTRRTLHEQMGIDR